MSLWERLPLDILHKILNQTVLLSDFIRFGAVCKTWYVVFLDNKPRRIEQCNNEVPLLFIPTPYMHNEHNVVPLPNQLLNMFEPKFHSCMSPVIPSRPLETQILSASYGWLATIIPEEECVVMILNNPMTGKTIYLPPLLDYRSGYAISDVVLSCNPSVNPDECVVAYSTLYSIGFIRLGGKEWTEFDITTQRKPESIIFYESKLYFVDWNRDLFAIDFQWGPNNGDTCEFQCFQVCEMSDYRLCQRLYLVESGRGELLMIERNFVRYNSVFMVYKLVVTHDGKGEWVRIHRVGNGDEALFLTNDPNCNAIISKCTNLQPDSVYYGVTDNSDGCYKMRRFTLNKVMQPDEYIETGVTTRKWYCEPFWINPTLR